MVNIDLSDHRAVFHFASVHLKMSPDTQQHCWVLLICLCSYGGGSYFCWKVFWCCFGEPRICMTESCCLMVMTAQYWHGFLPIVNLFFKFRNLYYYYALVVVFHLSVYPVRGRHSEWASTESHNWFGRDL